MISSSSKLVQYRWALSHWGTLQYAYMLVWAWLESRISQRSTTVGCNYTHSHTRSTYGSSRAHRQPVHTHWHTHTRAHINMKQRGALAKHVYRDAATAAAAPTSREHHSSRVSLPTIPVPSTRRVRSIIALCCSSLFIVTIGVALSIGDSRPDRAAQLIVCNIATTSDLSAIARSPNRLTFERTLSQSAPQKRTANTPIV